jgi:hypothetical protein
VGKPALAILAVIGRSWLSVTDADGRLRIQNPEDFVAIEIAEALLRAVTVIPDLGGGAKIPISSELPLARRPAM